MLGEPELPQQAEVEPEKTRVSTEAGVVGVERGLHLVIEKEKEKEKDDVFLPSETSLGVLQNTKPGGSYAELLPYLLELVAYQSGVDAIEVRACCVPLFQYFFCLCFVPKGSSLSPCRLVLLLRDPPLACTGTARCARV